MLVSEIFEGNGFTREKINDLFHKWEYNRDALLFVLDCWESDLEELHVDFAKRVQQISDGLSDYVRQGLIKL